MSIGSQIKYYRELRNLTQAELAQRAGISVSALRKYEIEERIPKESYVLKVAEALNIPVSKLLEVELPLFQGTGSGSTSDSEALKAFSEYISKLSEEEKQRLTALDGNKRDEQITNRLTRRFSDIVYRYVRKSLAHDELIDSISDDDVHCAFNHGRVEAVIDAALTNLDRTLELTTEFPAVPEELYSKK